MKWNGKSVELDCQMNTAASWKPLQIGEAGYEVQHDNADHV